MAKRLQEQKKIRKKVRQNRNLQRWTCPSHVPTSSSSAKSLISSKSPGDNHSYGETWKQDEKKFEIGRSVEFSSATGRCIPWRVDGHSHGETCRYQRGVRECGPFRIWNWQEKMWQRNQLLTKQLRKKPYASSKSDCQGGPKAEKIEWSHNLHVSPATIHHTEAVFSTVRGSTDEEHDDLMNDLDVNMAIWCTFLNATLRAAVHLGQDHEANLRYVKNNFRNSVGQLFNETGETDQWTERDHWCKHNYRFQRCHGCRKLFVQPSLSNHPRQSLCLLRLCALCGKNGRWSYCDLEEQN